MINVNQSVGVSAEFQVIVRRTDGSIKLDTGMQRNLLLDNAFKLYMTQPMIANTGMEIPHKNYMMTHCFVGTGNTAPTETDVSLASMVARQTSVTDKTYGLEVPTDTLHPGYVKAWQRARYVFDTITNQNITEVGLASWNGTHNDNGTVYEDLYTLCTRALIKGTDGQPISITVLEDEILEVIYQINMYVDVQRKTGTFDLTTTVDGVDTVATYDYFMQPHSVVNTGYLDRSLAVNSFYNLMYTWGVKEVDAELDNTYDLNDPAYTGITFKSTNTLSEKVGEKKDSSSRYDKYSALYSDVVNVEADLASNTYTHTIQAGIYSHIHPNGIRAFQVSVGHFSTYRLVNGLIVVKNQANGQGIKKTDRQIWEFEFGYTLTRWGG